jgi:hypothetical protein
MSTYDTIREAIRHKRQIVATYRGHRREMCPHVIGVKSGKPATLGRRGRPGKPATHDEAHVFCYQFGGTSDRVLGPDGSGDNWRCIAIAELTNVRVRPGRWHTAPQGSHSQTCIDIDRIDLEVA